MAREERAIYLVAMQC